MLRSNLLHLVAATDMRGRGTQAIGPRRVHEQESEAVRVDSGRRKAASTDKLS